MTSAVVDFEELLTNGFSDANTSAVVQGGVRARWERKKDEALESENSRTLSDRFIPNRAAMDLDKASHAIATVSDTEGSIGDRTDGEASEDEEHTMNSVASDLGEYKTSLLGIDDSKSRILSFADKAPAPKGDTVNNLEVLYSASTTARKGKSSTKLVSRHIPSAPTRILDAPDLLDDYYLNLLSWSDTNVLAVALSQTVYLWNAETGAIDELCNVEDQGPDAHISSVAWIQEGGGHLAVGTSWVSSFFWFVDCRSCGVCPNHPSTFHLDRARRCSGTFAPRSSSAKWTDTRTAWVLSRGTATPCPAEDATTSSSTMTFALPSTRLPL